MAIKHILAAGISASTIAGGIGGVYYLNLDKTIEDKLSRTDLKLISKSAKDEIWQIAWNEIKDDTNLNKLVAEVTDNTKLKSWCIDTYNRPLGDKENTEKVKKLCIFPPLNIKEKLARKNKVLSTTWNTKLAAVKGESGLLEKIKSINNLDRLDNLPLAEKALEGWCKKQLSISLKDDADASKYKEVEKLCCP